MTPVMTALASEGSRGATGQSARSSNQTLLYKADPCRIGGEVQRGWCAMPKMFVDREECESVQLERSQEMVLQAEPAERWREGRRYASNSSNGSLPPLFFLMTLLATRTLCSCRDVCRTWASCPGTDWLCPSQSIGLSFCHLHTLALKRRVSSTVSFPSQVTYT